jgi:hypothetical protein
MLIKHKNIYELMLLIAFCVAPFSERVCVKNAPIHVLPFYVSKINTSLFCFSDYLGNVLEDLGLSLSDHLQQVSTLLRLSPEEYQTKSSGCSPRLVAAVRQMRNITSSG